MVCFQPRCVMLYPKALLEIQGFSFPLFEKSRLVQIPSQQCHIIAIADLILAGILIPINSI